MTFDGWNDVLSHHGIKGMHWGVRRTAEELGHITESGSKGLSSISSIKKREDDRQTRNKIASMSDDDLRKVVNRINLEKQYSDLTRADKTKGLELVQNLLGIVGSVAAITVAGVNIYSALRYGESDDKKKNK